MSEYYGVWPEGRNTPIVISVPDFTDESKKRSYAIEKAKESGRAGSSTVNSKTSCSKLSESDQKNARKGNWIRTRKPGTPQSSDAGGFKYRPQLKEKAKGLDLKKDSGIMVGKEPASLKRYKIKKCTKDGMPDGEIECRYYSSKFAAEKDYIDRYGKETFGEIEEIERTDADIPSKYLSGLKGAERDKREKEIKERQSGKHSYKSLPGDEGAKTEKSEYTSSFEKKYGEKLGGDRSIKNIAKVISSDFPNVTTEEIEKALRESRRRGMEAWVSGHRPGANQEQWWRARIYSLIMGGKTSQTADSDLYKILKGKKEAEKD